MQSVSTSEIWDDLKPRIDALIATRITSSSVRSAGATGGAVSAHALSGALHTGLLDDGQAPQFLLRSGGRSLTGNLAVDSGITVDGVDISVHAANPDAHHATATEGDGIDITGQVVAVDATVVRTSRLLTAGDGLTGGGTLAADRTFAVGAGDGITVAADSVGLTTPGTLSVSSANVAAGNHTHAITSSYDVSAGTSAILRSNAGALTLAQLTTPLIDAPVSLSIEPTVNLDLAPGTDVLLNPAGDVVLGDGLSFRTNSFSTLYPIEGMIVAETAVAGQYGLSIGVIEADELRVRVFVADEVRIDRGEEIWSKSYGITAADFTTPGSIGGTVTVTFESSPMIAGALFTANDWLLFRTIDIDTGVVLSAVWGQVTGYTATNIMQFWTDFLPDSAMPLNSFPKVDLGTTTQDWTFTLRSGDTNYRIPEGSLGIDYGASGQSYIAFSVTDPVAAPYIRIRRWTGADPYSPANHDDTVYIGNLNGIANASGDRGIWTQNEAGTSWAELSDDGVILRNASIALYDGVTQKVNIGASGTDFWMGASSADKRLYWNGTTLAITGQITVSSGSSGYANITDKPTSLSGINSTEGTKLSGIAAGATVGATWGTNLNSIPTRFGDAPGAAGLYLTSTHMGYYNGSAWKAWIASSGEFYFGGSTGAHLEWNGTKLRGLGTDGTTEQWYADSTTGKLYAGAGSIWLDTVGESISATLETSKFEVPGVVYVYTSISDSIVTGSDVLWTRSGTTRARMLGGYGSWDSGNDWFGGVRFDMYGVIDTVSYSSEFVMSWDGFGMTSAGGKIFSFSENGSTIDSNLVFGNTYNISIDKILALDSGGLHLGDDGGNLGVFIEDGGYVGIGTNNPAKQLHVAGTLLIDGDQGGVAGTIGLTDIFSGVSSGIGTVKMSGSTARDSDQWIKIYIGTVAHYIPCWSNIS